MWLIYRHGQLHFPNSVFVALPATGVSNFAYGRVTHAGLDSGPANLNVVSANHC